MALGTPTDRGNDYGYKDTFTVPAFTPSANCLLVASITHYSAATISSITGHGTWTQIGSDSTAGNGIITRMYGCITSGSPSSDAVVMVTSAVLTSLIEITEITGTVVSSVAAAITQSKPATGYGTAVSVTFDATPTKTTLATCYSQADVTALDGTDLLDLSHTYGQNHIITAYTATPGDATVDGTISIGTYWTILAIEFAEAGGADTTPPTFSVAPAVTPSSSGGTATATIDETGDIFYVVVADGASAPSSAQVLAGQNASGAAALAAGSDTAGTVLSDVFTGLSASTAYDAYFVARDDEGTPNVQASPTKVDFTTSAAGGSKLLLQLMNS